MQDNQRSKMTHI